VPRVEHEIRERAAGVHSEAHQAPLLAVVADLVIPSTLSAGPAFRHRPSGHFCG
jgi:hypothetical protein